jgi:teichuronic acid biosynthesis glycosyltransferase TuaC
LTRALVVTPIYPMPDNPQAGIFVHRQVANLVRHGVECRVLAFRPAPPPFPLWMRRRAWLKYYWGRVGWPRSPDGVPVDHVFYRRRGARLEDAVPAIGDALVRHVASHPECQDADVIYAHWLWPGGAAALSLRERFGWPVAAIARGSEMHDWQGVHEHCRPYVERVLREADRPLANCLDLRDRADLLVPGTGARMDVVYNGCDADTFRPAGDRAEVRRELGLDPCGRLLLFCGDISTRKGAYELAEAWGGFAERNPEWRLVVVGRESEPDAAARLRQAAGGRAIFAGHVSHARVVKYLQAADGYVQPSRLEGLANATMEAMAVGLPVITTDTCGQRELIGHGENGWLVPPEDPVALGRALDEVAADPDRAARFGREARRTIETRFNPRLEAAKLARILEAMRTSRERCGDVANTVAP